MLNVCKFLADIFQKSVCCPRRNYSQPYDVEARVDLVYSLIPVSKSVEFKLQCACFWMLIDDTVDPSYFQSSSRIIYIE